MDYYPHYDDWDDLYALIRDLFVAAAIGCLLLMLNKIARGVTLGGRITALRKLDEAYTPEEREQLIHIIKKDSLRS